MKKNLNEITDQIDIDRLFEGELSEEEESEYESVRRVSAELRRKRNLRLANMMIYIGIALLIVSCIAIGYFIFIGNKGVEIASLSFNNDNISLRINHSEKPEIIVEPVGYEFVIYFSSSDESVAVVSKDGKITALKEGSTVITAKSGGLKAECQVNVIPDTIDEIRTTSRAIVLEGGESRKIVYRTLPDYAMEKNIIFSTADENIAIVDNDGNVKGIDFGETAVTITDTITGKKKEIPVVVVSIEVPQNIEFSEEKVYVDIEKTYKTEVKFTPDSISDKKLIFTTSDNLVASVDEDGIVTAKSAGTCEITASYENMQSIVCTMTINVIDPFVIIG